MTAFAQLVRDWRRARLLTQGEAAALVGATQVTWSNWETGRGVPALANIASLAKLLKVKRAALLLMADEADAVAKAAQARAANP